MFTWLTVFWKRYQIPKSISFCFHHIVEKLCSSVAIELRDDNHLSTGFIFTTSKLPNSKFELQKCHLEFCLNSKILRWFAISLITPWTSQWLDAKFKICWYIWHDKWKLHQVLHTKEEFSFLLFGKFWQKHLTVNIAFSECNFECFSQNRFEKIRKHKNTILYLTIEPEMLSYVGFFKPQAQHDFKLISL